jgi:hypothetical protein
MRWLEDLASKDLPTIPQVDTEASAKTKISTMTTQRPALWPRTMPSEAYKLPTTSMQNMRSRPPEMTMVRRPNLSTVKEVRIDEELSGVVEWTGETPKAWRGKTGMEIIQCDYLSSHIVGGPYRGLATLMARREQLVS